jgi:hypothetical protein
MELEFRILQKAKDVFIIQKKITRVHFEGFLFWKKEYETQYWCRVDLFGNKSAFYSYIENSTCLIDFKTLEEAQEWIADYYKYPIIHEVK